MSELASNTQVSADALRRLWIYRLSGAVKAVLSGAQDTKLEGLAEMAYKIMENLHPHEVAAITPTPTPDFATADGDDPGNKTDGLLYDMRLIKLEDAEENRGQSNRSPDHTPKDHVGL
ncbi:hypothetical protein JYU34_015082 [Plutella xylostella]|uniref:Uncharacterized protein n=1 Tax=Plutella xylostella TaxID=51655 RepID=A0ABQ7Q783_PLUXY|nr:hypothetical protein JYU34_015082 [Plutella xylostella]